MDLVSESIRFVPTPPLKTGAGGSGSSTVTGKTLKIRDSHQFLNGVTVVIDGGDHRSSDESGKVDLSDLVVGVHQFALTAPDGRTLSFNAYVGQTYLQTVTIPDAVVVDTGPVAPAIAPMIIGGDMPDGKIGDNVSVAYAVAGGEPPYTWNFPFTGSIPTGMGVTSVTNADGSVFTITGSYTATGDFSFSVQALDSVGSQKTLDDTVHVADAGSWIDITSDTYWEPNDAGSGINYVWDGSHWNVIDVSCGTLSGIKLTAAGVTAAAGSNKFRFSLVSASALNNEAPLYANGAGGDANLVFTSSVISITSTDDPIGTVYSNVTPDPPGGGVGLGALVQVSVRCTGDYPSDNYNFTKIEVFV